MTAGDVPASLGEDVAAVMWQLPQSETCAGLRLDLCRSTRTWKRLEEHETRSMPGLTWTVMTDPEGNVVCVGTLSEE